MGRLTTWEINLVRFGSASLALLLIAFIGNVWPLVRTAVGALPWRHCRGRPSPPQGHELQALENSSSHERGVGAEGVALESLDPAAVGFKLVMVETSRQREELGRAFPPCPAGTGPGSPLV